MAFPENRNYNPKDKLDNVLILLACTIIKLSKETLLQKIKPLAMEETDF